MFDNKNLEALALVIEEGGFDKAAKRLYLTQSAISQRIKLLEDDVGQILLTRTFPPIATEAGLPYLAHYRMLKELESNLPHNSFKTEALRRHTLAIAVNADSLATWFLDAVVEIVQQENLILDIRVDDQEETHKLLVNGLVSGCITAQAKVPQGCKMEKIADVEYGLFCTPIFKKRWFANGFDFSDGNLPPTIRFNRKDRLVHQFFDKFLNIEPSGFPTFFVPSSEKYLDFILRNLCFGIIPNQQSESLQKTGCLIDIFPGKRISVPLFYHYWNLHSKIFGTFTEKFLVAARTILSTSPNSIEK